MRIALQIMLLAALIQAGWHTSFREHYAHLLPGSRVAEVVEAEHQRKLEAAREKARAAARLKKATQPWMWQQRPSPFDSKP